eukprot:scaffold266907_cov42-Prasinocladus_malaysianus.AAC.2
MSKIKRSSLHRKAVKLLEREIAQQDDDVINDSIIEMLEHLCYHSHQELLLVTHDATATIQSAVGARGEFSEVSRCEFASQCAQASLIVTDQSKRKCHMPNLVVKVHWNYQNAPLAARDEHWQQAPGILIDLPDAMAIIVSRVQHAINSISLGLMDQWLDGDVDLTHD